MHKSIFKTDANQIFKRTFPAFTLMAFFTISWLTGCASIDRKEESIRAILLKENALLEKLQAERKQPEVTQAVSENESLTKAETHLFLVLEELMSANKTIQSQILKPNKEEVRNGHN